MSYISLIFYLFLLCLPKLSISQDVVIRKHVIANMGIYKEGKADGEFTVLSTVGQPIGTKVFVSKDGRTVIEGFQDGFVTNDMIGKKSKTIEKINLNVYPNPFKNKLNLKVDNFSQNGNYNIVVSTLLGKIIFNKKLYISNSVIDITINNLSSGNYLIYAMDSKGNVLFSKNIVRN